MMTSYHYNASTASIEVCLAMISCPHGDLDQDHYSSEEQIRDAFDLMSFDFNALMLIVNQISERMDNFHANTGIDVGDVRSATASFAFRLGALAVGSNESSSAQAALASMQDSLLALMQRGSAASLSLESLIPVIDATNLLGELGSKLNRIGVRHVSA